MDRFSKRHRLVVSMLVLLVPVLTGAKGRGCQVPDSSGGGPGGGGPGPAPTACVVTGCSGQLCADEDIASTCEWREEYACYAKHGVCERDASGECGWRETPELAACLGGDEPAPCVVSGCSGQVCADEDVATDCAWREEYACYQELGVCERDASGACGWRETPELAACLGGGEPAPCVVSGCSGQICADEPMASTCEWREEYACYQELGVCERDASGACGWRETPELAACLDGGEPAPCVVTGCSGQVCADRDVITTCEFREEYACYQELGVCERDASGACGWRETPELDACIAAASGDDRVSLPARP
ncbi:hypothetical protein WMF31_08240 [Sorangium sp. So ce1036]|uniref:hypothetical protein n=1 Tax=Sorangium sp. So ce1036 TaxID=3133328 RepID=UPI003EFE2677